MTIERQDNGSFHGELTTNQSICQRTMHPSLSEGNHLVDWFKGNAKPEKEREEV